MSTPYAAHSTSVPRGSVPVSAVILALDEETNIERCLTSLAWASQVIVVDSGSTDGTARIARDCGATVIDTHWRGFGPQREFALRLPDVTHDWIFFLDADEWASDELATEIAGAITSTTYTAYWQYVRLVFRGRWIRHCGWYPSARLVRLMRRSTAHYPDSGFSEHAVIAGEVGHLTADLVDEDHKGLARWAQKHVRYAELEAARRANRTVTPLSLRSHDSSLRHVLKDVVAPRMPARPLATFCYMYVVRGGFLDGREGLLFCFLHGWFQVMVGQLQQDLEHGTPGRVASTPRRGQYGA